MNSPAPRPLALARWLFCVAALVVFIVAVGGITRLTESGLSITEWKPVSGILPPLNEAQWEKAFDDYKQIPQYIEVTGPAGMTLADFMFIFFWEWVHRVIARIIGTYSSFRVASNPASSSPPASVRSWPEQKPGPAPVNTITRA